MRASIESERIKYKFELEKVNESLRFSQRKEEELGRRLETADREKSASRNDLSQREDSSREQQRREVDLRDQLRRSKEDNDDLREVLEQMRRKRQDGLISTKLREQDLEGKCRDLNTREQETCDPSSRSLRIRQ